MNIEERKDLLLSLRKQKYEICLKLADYLINIYAQFRSRDELERNLSIARSNGEGKIDRTLEYKLGQDSIVAKDEFYSNIGNSNVIFYKLKGYETLIAHGIYSAMIHIANGFYPAAYDLGGKVSGYFAAYKSMPRKDLNDISDMEECENIMKFQVLDADAMNEAFEAENAFKNRWKGDLDKFVEVFNEILNVRQDLSYLNKINVDDKD